MGTCSAIQEYAGESPSARDPSAGIRSASGTGSTGTFPVSLSRATSCAPRTIAATLAA